MNWQGKRVLVTGAGGFIGSHLAERLVQEGAKVRAFVHYNALGTRGWMDGSPVAQEMEIFAGDIRDRDSVSEATRQVEVIFHLAALIAIPYSYRAPISYVHTNIEGTLNVLQCARENHVERLVHTSTSEVYGTAKYVPIDEAHPLQAQSPYAASKIGADKLAEAFHLSFGMPVVIVRPFNTFGPRQSARAVIPTIIIQCLGGSTVRLGNLHPTRDLNYVANTVDGFLSAGLSPRATGKTINLGSGQETSVQDLTRVIGELIGRAVKIEVAEDRIRPPGSEVDRLLADPGLARKIMDWEPKIGLREGLVKTIEWIEKHRERYRPDVYSL